MISISIYMISTLFILGLFLLTCAFYHMMQSVPESKKRDDELPFVSVLVPARNEEGKIERCIESILAQDYPKFELIIIDDRSTDRTGEIISEYAKKDKRIKFVQGKDAPDGWIGKCNALAHSVRYASGDWFIFTDADTCHKPNSLRDAVSHAVDNKLDLLSFIPVQELGSFPERLVMPVLLSSFLLGDPFHTVNDKEAARAYAYGQFVMTRREPYIAIGGHQAVRDEIVEDHALARVFKEKGFKIACADGKSLYSVRMYTDWVTLWQGWTKNLYSFIDSKLSNLFLLLILMNIVLILPYFELAWVIAEWMEGDISVNLYRLTFFVLAQYVVLFSWFKRVSEHQDGLNWMHFFLIPFGGIAVQALFVHAAYLVVFGEQVNWKGRKYVVSTAKTIKSKHDIEKAKLAPDVSD